MIRALLVDDHPALRAGLGSVLRAEPGFTPVATAASAAEGMAELARWDVDVAIVDYHLPDEDGLRLCWRIKATAAPPRVLVYSAYADAELALPAVAAGADGLANKGAPAEDLFDVIRLVARGHRVMPPISAELVDERAGGLDSSERLVLERLVEGRAIAEIAAEAGVAEERIASVTSAIVEKLRLDVRRAV